MKKFRFLSIFMTGIFLVLLGSINVNAAITWTGDSFRYGVDTNGGDILNTVDPNGGYMYSGYGPESIYSLPDPINSVAYSPYECPHVDMQLYAGGQGGIFDDGAYAQAYAQVNLDLASGTEAVSIMQDLNSWVNRKFSVSESGYYDLNASILGEINETNFPAFYASNYYHASYVCEGGVTLKELKEEGGGILTLWTKHLTLQQLWEGTDTIEGIPLRVFDENLEPVYYSLSVGFNDIETNVSNYGWPPDVLGDLENLYELGSPENPLYIEAHMTPGSAPVPIPGTLLLMLSGLMGLCSFKNLSFRSRRN